MALEKYLTGIATNRNVHVFIPSAPCLPLMANDHSGWYVSVVAVIKYPALTGSASPPSPGPQRVLGWRKSETRIPALSIVRQRSRRTFFFPVISYCLYSRSETKLHVCAHVCMLTGQTDIRKISCFVVRDRDHPCCAICLFLLSHAGCQARVS